MTWQNYKCKTLSSSLIIQRTTSVYSFVLFFISGWKRWGSQPIRCSRDLISVSNSSVSAGAFWGAELSLLNVLQHVSFASVSSPGHGLQREGRLFWIPLPVPHRWLQGVPGDTAGHGRAKQKVCVCGVSLFGVLDACPECFGCVEDYRHYPVFVFTSGSRGGPEWRTVSKSKPIRTHFCCNPPFLLPIPTTQSPLPRTDDVTDCCEQFPWKRPPPLWPTFQAALSPSIRPTPPFPPPSLSLSPTLSFCLCPSLPAAQPLFTTCQTRRWREHTRTLEGRGGVTKRKLTAVGKKKKRHSQ